MTSVRIEDNIWATAVGDTGDIEKLLRYKMPGYQFSPAGKRGWNGWIEMTKTSGDDLGWSVMFPAGLVSYVMSQPWAKTWTLTDRRSKPKGLNLYSPAELGDLEPHQIAAVDAALADERGIIQYPTGVGKGRIIGELVRCLRLPTLVIVDKLDLVKQLGDEIELCIGEPVGRFGGGRALDGNCVVGTYQTLVKRPLAWLNKFKAVIIDEGHHAEAKSYEQLLSAMECAYYRFALSATAFKSWAGKPHDPTFLKVQAYTGPPVSTMTLSEGVDTGRIVPADVFIVGGVPWKQDYEVPDEFDPKTMRRPNYKEEYEEHIVRNAWRNAAIVSLASSLRKAGPTIVLVQRVEHGTALAKAIGCPFISGATEDRDAYYSAFKSGGIDCLVLSTIADEGLDLPNIEHLILAGGGKADHRQIQRLGRGMRASEGKTNLTAVDFADQSKYLGPHYRQRRRLYDREPAYTPIDLDISELDVVGEVE